MPNTAAKDRIGFLQRVPLFAGASQAALIDIACKVERRDHAANEIIIRRGDAGDAVYFLVSGEAEARVGNNGSAKAIATFGAHDFFGEMSMFDHEPRSASVVAVKPCTTLRLTRADFKMLTDEHPIVLWNICAEFTKRLRSTSVLLAS